MTVAVKENYENAMVEYQKEVRDMVLEGLLSNVTADVTAKGEGSAFSPLLLLLIQ